MFNVFAAQVIYDSLPVQSVENILPHNIFYITSVGWKQDLLL